MKRLLVLNDFSILPPDEGGRISTYQLYRRLSETFDVTYVCLSRGHEVEEVAVNPRFREIRVPKSRVHRRFETLIGRRLGVPAADVAAMLMCAFEPGLRSTLRRRGHGADAIVLVHPYLYPVVRLARRPLVYDSHNVESHLKRTILGDSALARALVFLVRIDERSLARRARVVFARSVEDAAAFEGDLDVPRRSLCVSGNGADLSAPASASRPGPTPAAGDRPSAIFVASAHPPNVDAARAITDLIAPAVPEVDFILCGAVGHALPADRLPDNVKVTLRVSEAVKSDLYSRAQVALNPMSSGSGTNVKMLEYMTVGLPVVTTPVGARGLGLDARTAEICDVGDFGAAIRRLLADPARWAEVAENASRHVRATLDWDEIADRVSAVLDGLIGPETAGRGRWGVGPGPFTPLSLGRGGSTRR